MKTLEKNLFNTFAKFIFFKKKPIKTCVKRRRKSWATFLTFWILLIKWKLAESSPKNLWRCKWCNFQQSSSSQTVFDGKMAVTAKIITSIMLMDRKWNNLTSKFAWKFLDYQFAIFYHDIVSFSVHVSKMCLFPMKKLAHKNFQFHLFFFFLFHFQLTKALGRFAIPLRSISY